MVTAAGSRKLVLLVSVVAALAAAGCGGGGGGGGPSPTPRPTATAGPAPTSTPVPGPTATPGPLPGVPFTLRGRVLLNGSPAAGGLVTVTGISGTTASDQTQTSSAGSYSFYLVAGTYTVQAVVGTRSASRDVSIPPGGQTVDNFDLAL